VAVARARALALLLTAVTASALLGAIVLAVRLTGVDRMQVAITILLALPAAAVGLVVGLRQPRNPVGPLVSMYAAVFGIVFGWQGAYDQAAADHPGSLPVHASVAVWERGTWVLLFVPIGLLLLLFPAGRLLSRRWRWVVAGLVLIAVTFPVIAALSPRPLPPPYQDLPHPFGTAPLWLRAVGWAELPILLGLLVMSAVSLVLRHNRSADRVERAQIRWLALGAWALPVTLLLCWVSLLLLGRPDLGVIGLCAMAVTMPVSIAVAVLRHELYDVDRALSATVSYSVLTAVVLGVFTLCEVVVGTLLGGGSALAAAVATAVTAGLLAPVRRWARAGVDRRLYPMRVAAHRALTQLRRDIDEGAAQPEDLERALRGALQAPLLRVGYLPPGGGDVPTTSSGDPVLTGIQVRLAGTPVGVLDPGSSPAPDALLREVADASAVFVELGRLRLGIKHAMAEIQRSRARLQVHGYQERRTLQRNLHDGPQQRLVALGMSLRLAQRHLGDDGFDVDGLLDQAMTQLGTAVAELRTIAAGLRPPALDSGLGTAIRSLVASVPLAVELDMADDEVPDDVATTAYYVVSEGLSNAMKHARADRVRVLLTRCDRDLVVEVHDDGVGGAHAGGGSGLAGLADRVAAASGELRVITVPGEGTQLQAVLPCGS